MHFIVSAKGSERRDFLREIDMMKKVSEGQNPHVVSLIGCVTIQEPLCLITEYMKYGDLLMYLRTNRKLVRLSLNISLKCEIGTAVKWGWPCTFYISWKVKYHKVFSLTFWYIFDGKRTTVIVSMCHKTNTLNQPCFFFMHGTNKQRKAGWWSGTEIATQHCRPLNTVGWVALCRVIFCIVWLQEKVYALHHETCRMYIRHINFTFNIQVSQNGNIGSSYDSWTLAYDCMVTWQRIQFA